jgi:type III secretion system needle length determinant
MALDPIATPGDTPLDPSGDDASKLPSPPSTDDRDRFARAIAGDATAKGRNDERETSTDTTDRKPAGDRPLPPATRDLFRRRDTRDKDPERRPDARSDDASRDVDEARPAPAGDKPTIVPSPPPSPANNQADRRDSRAAEAGKQPQPSPDGNRAKRDDTDAGRTPMPIPERDRRADPPRDDEAAPVPAADTSRPARPAHDTTSDLFRRRDMRDADSPRDDDAAPINTVDKSRPARSVQDRTSDLFRRRDTHDADAGRIPIPVPDRTGDASSLPVDADAMPDRAASPSIDHDRGPHQPDKSNAGRDTSGRSPVPNQRPDDPSFDAQAHGTDRSPADKAHDDRPADKGADRMPADERSEAIPPRPEPSGEIERPSEKKPDAAEPPSRDDRALFNRAIGKPEDDRNDDDPVADTPPVVTADMILRGLAPPPQVADAAPVTATPPATSMNEAVREIADRILVGQSATTGQQEVRILLKGDMLGGTEVRISEHAGAVEVTLVAPTKDVEIFLQERGDGMQAQLSQRLDREVRVDVVPADAPMADADRSAGEQSDGRSRNRRSVRDEQEN